MLLKRNMIDFKTKPTSFYFTETDLKKILLEVSSQPMLVMTWKRQECIKEIGAIKDNVVGKFITEQQFEQLRKKKVKNTEPEYLTFDDVDLIDGFYARYSNSNIKKVQHAIIKSFIGGGFRVQELCSFDPDYIDKENNRIHVLGKGKKWRWTHVDEDFITFLLGFKDKYNCAANPVFQNSYDIDYRPMFLNSDGKPFTPRNMQKFMDNVSRSVQALSHELHPHLLRHTYGVFRVLKNPTISIEELRQDMGHEDIRTTQIYFRLAEAERIKLAKRRNINNHTKETEKKQEMTAFCKGCGKSIDQDSKFCRYCGIKQ